MTTFLLTTLFLLTILASFAVGIAAAYWMIWEFLNLFDPKRTGSKPAKAPALAPTAGGD